MSSNSISFIIPVYNASKYLEECVASIVPQIDDGDEIILVNDGSTDSSPEICERLASENPGIRLINKANGGVSSARNTGIDSAKNEWLYFIDADDKLFPKAVEEMKKAAEQGGELIIGGYTSGETPAPRNGKETRLSCEDMISLLLCYPRHMNIVSEECRFEGMGLWPCWGKLFKRETVLSNNIRFSEELFLGEDLLFNLQYIQHINSGTAINSEMYFYRLNNSSVTSRFQSKRIINTISLCNKLWANVNVQANPQYLTDISNFTALRAVACYQLYFNHPDNPLTFAEREKEFRDFLNLEMIEKAVKNADVLHLSSGKKQNVRYGLIVHMMKLKKTKALLKMHL